MEMWKTSQLSLKKHLETKKLIFLKSEGSEIQKLEVPNTYGKA